MRTCLISHAHHELPAGNHVHDAAPMYQRTKNFDPTTGWNFCLLPEITRKCNNSAVIGNKKKCCALESRHLPYMVSSPRDGETFFFIVDNCSFFVFPGSHRKQTTVPPGGWVKQFGLLVDRRCIMHMIARGELMMSMRDEARAPPAGPS